jgi:hypothetical protein
MRLLFYSFGNYLTIPSLYHLNLFYIFKIDNSLCLLYYNGVFIYHQHNHSLVFINIKYMATFCDHRLGIFMPVHNRKIKLQLQIHFKVRLRSK